MQYEGSLLSALEYANAWQIEQWVHEFLLSDGRNRAFSDGLKLADRCFLGPMIMPLALFARCCGPEENMKYRTDAAGFERRVNGLMEAILVGKDIPPLIVNFVRGRFELSDGNHRFEAYTRLGTQEQHVIVWITKRSDYEMFKKDYGKYFCDAL